MHNKLIEPYRKLYTCWSEFDRQISINNSYNAKLLLNSLRSHLDKVETTLDEIISSSKTATTAEDEENYL